MKPFLASRGEAGQWAFRAGYINWTSGLSRMQLYRRGLPADVEHEFLYVEVVDEQVSQREDLGDPFELLSSDGRTVPRCHRHEVASVTGECEVCEDVCCDECRTSHDVEVDDVVRRNAQLCSSCVGRLEGGSIRHGGREVCFRSEIGSPKHGAPRAGIAALLLSLLLAGAGYSGWLWLRGGSAPDVYAFVLEGIQVVPLVTPDEAVAGGWGLSGPMAVTDDGRLVFESNGELIDLETGTSLLEQPAPGVTSMVGVGRSLIAVRGRELSTFLDGTLAPQLGLPGSGFVISIIEDGLLLAGRRDGVTEFEVFHLTQGALGKLLSFPDSVHAVVGFDDRVFVAVGGRVISWHQEDGEARVVDIGDGAGIVKSIAIDPATGVLFVSAGYGVFAYAGGAGVLLAAGVSGDLLWSEGGESLLVKDSETRTITALRNVRSALGDELQRSADATIVEAP